jgi:flagellar biosynthesis protein FliR
MNLFDFSEEQLLSFFAVLIRYATMFAVFPIFGHKSVPSQVKILLALSISFILFPALVSQGWVNPDEANVWASSLGGIVGVVSLEVLVGLTLGFVAKIIFDAIQIGGNLVGHFMGLAAATYYDPTQESQSGVVAQVQTTLAMLLFLVLDGHHIILKAALDSYRYVGLGKASFSGAIVQEMILYGGSILKIGIQIAAPVAFSIFAVNVVYAVMAKAMPQLNVLVLSFSVSAFVGIFVLLGSLIEFSSVVTELFGGLDHQMATFSRLLGGG